MYFYKTRTIVNSTTGPEGVIPLETDGPHLLRIYRASVLAIEKNEGDVTHEDLRLVQDELLRRLQSHP